MNEKADIDNISEQTSDINDELIWTTHPLRRRPLAAVIVTFFILVVSMLVFYTTDSKAFALLALVVLFASVAKFYLPTRFTLTDHHIIIKSTTQTIKKEWLAFRSCYADKNGILLSPFPEPSRLENFRGLYLIFGNNRDEVIAFVKRYINTQTELTEKDTTSEESGDTG